MTLIHSSAAATNMVVTLAEQRADWRAKGYHVDRPFGIAELDDYVVGLWPGDVMYTVSLANSGKSSTARIMMSAHLKKIMQINADQIARGEDPERIACIWVTTEESVQKAQGAFIASGSNVITINDIMSGGAKNIRERDPKALLKAAQLPLYIIGQPVYMGQKRSDAEKAHSTRLTREEIWNGIKCVEKQGFRIGYVVIDYLQRITPEGHDELDQKTHMRKCVEWSRDIATHFGTIVHVCAQARAEVSSRKLHIPGSRDVEWAPGPGSHVPDLIVGLWMPKATLGNGVMLDRVGKYPEMMVTPDLCFVMVAKQRDGFSGDIFATSLKPHMWEWKGLAVGDLPGPAKKSTNGEIPF